MVAPLRNARKLAALAVAALIALTLAAPTPAAAKQSKAEAAFLKAVQAHKAGKIKEAIESLEEAVKSDRHPTLLFNVGVLADRAGDAKKAAKYYQDYLDTQPEDASMVLIRFQQIAPKEAEAWAKAKDGKGADDGKGDGKALAKKDDAKEGDDKKGDDKKGDDKKGDDAAGTGNVLTYSLLGAGGVALALGGVFGAMTVSNVNDFMDSRVRSEAQRHADDAKANQLLANISFAAGLLAVGAGLYILLTSDTAATAATAAAAPASAGPTSGWTWTPAVGPDRAGGAVGFEF